MTRSSALLLTAFLSALLSGGQLAAQAPPIPLTVEKIFAHGSLTGEQPSEIAWSPDSRHLTYIDGGQLIDLDPGSGRPHVLVSHAKLAPLTKEPASERDQDHRARYHMADYHWAPDNRHLLFDSEGRLWLYDLHNGTGVEIAFSGQASGDDPKFSPNGEAISFVKDHGLAVVHLRMPGTPTTMLAPANERSVLNGEVDWIYLEELEARSNYFWSPDSKNIAYMQTSEASVPIYPITDWIPTHARVYLQSYPQPGDPNPDVRVGVVSAHGGKTVWVKLPIRAGEDYIPRFGWVDSKTLWIETLSRDQRHRSIYFARAGSGDAHPVLELTDDKFFNDDYDVNVADGSIVLTNWSDGHSHIYLYSYDEHDPERATAKLEKQLTSGDFAVSAIYRVDHAHKLVYYASNQGNPLEQQVWQVSFGGESRQLTSGAGAHSAIFAPEGSAFVDTYSSRMNPPSLELRGENGKQSVFWSTRALDAYGLRAPEQLEVKAQDGATLYATLLLPANKTAPSSVPVIVNPYGGPGPQEVANRWSSALLFDELLAEHGFAVLHTDNRGTGLRGRAFAQAAYHNFGPVQLTDQLTVLDAALARYPQLDSKRLGWWGWSWGGTFTLYAMTHSERFRAGVAVAPVTDWRNYDSIYTERYMSTPTEFPEGYKDFSVVNSADHLHGRLLLAHGTGDDNVHFANTVQFIQKLLEAGIPYDLQIYPRKTHSIAGGTDRTHLYSRILAHFEQYLMPPVQ
ncbi:MAG TPA: alpha/beta fold hydrolase [Terracidiphilus sp.]|nr:alpha/beta fold hydrolase [Terracidiphilus sp.]